MKRTVYELRIKRGNTTLVTPDSFTTGQLGDRIHTILANVALPGDELVIKVCIDEENA